MRCQNFLDVERRNIFSAAHDDVFLAVDDADVSVLLDHGHVAGVKPAAPQGFRSGFGLAPVASHDAVTAGDDFSHGDAVARDIVVCVIDDAQFGAGVGVAGHGLDHLFLLGRAMHVGL